MKKLLFAFIMLIATLFPFSVEAGIPLTKDNKNSRPLPKLIRIDPNAPKKASKKNPNAKIVYTQSSSSSFGPLTPKMAAFIEEMEDERRRSEYLKKQNYITSSTEWRTYFDERLQYSVEYPDILTKELEKPTNSSGLWLQSSDGYVRLTVLGKDNTTGRTAAGILNEISSKAKKVTILKKEHGSDWYRFIYRRAYDTVHRYGIVNDYVEAEFILGYPNEKSEQFKSVTERMEQTLQFAED